MSEAELSREEQFKVFTEWPGLMDAIFSHMANGGDLISFCDPKNIRYSDLAAWLTKDSKRAMILADAQAAGNEWIRQRILNELKHIALVDLREIYMLDGKLKHPSEWPDGIARALVGVETDELFEGVGKDRERVGFTKKVKFQDKIKALELWGREIGGMFAQKMKHEGTLTLEQLVAGSREKPNEEKAA